MSDHLLEYAEGRRRRHPRRCLAAACGAANVVGPLRTLHAMSIDPAFPDGWF